MKKNTFIKRCFDLAKQGVGNTAPNPMVGAVLVYNNKIIGEGFHAKYGKSHAEVAAIDSVHPTRWSLIPKSQLYVSLEPCCIVGNTPACTDLIKNHKIKNVSFSVTDPTPSVDGSSIRILKETGCHVHSNILPETGLFLLRQRHVWVKHKRPYVILKYAQSADNFMGIADKQIWLSNTISKIISHKWRSEVSAILVGTNTAEMDNPELTNRLYSGTSPIRIVIDRTLRLTPKLHLFDQKQATWVFTESSPPESRNNLNYYQVAKGTSFLKAILDQLYRKNKGFLLVEGGAQTLQNFIEAGFWDEARVFQTPKVLGTGIPAPTLPGKPVNQLRLKDNLLVQYLRSPI